MAIMRYTPRRIFSPWPEFTGFANRLPRLFDEPWNTPEPTRSWFPAVNVEEEPDELILTAELPGLAEEDVHLEIENNILTIRGEKREEREEGDDKRRFHVGASLWELPEGLHTSQVGCGRWGQGRLRQRDPDRADAQGHRGQEPHHRDQGRQVRHPFDSLLEADVAGPETSGPAFVWGRPARGGRSGGRCPPAAAPPPRPRRAPAPTPGAQRSPRAWPASWRP